MAYTVDSDFGAHTEIATKMETLLNAAGGTIVSCGVTKVGQDRFLIWIAYEAS
jgi:hypothetical protein